jgi:hypothetical protein
MFVRNETCGSGETQEMIRKTGAAGRAKERVASRSKQVEATDHGTAAPRGTRRGEPLLRNSDKPVRLRSGTQQASESERAPCLCAEASRRQITAERATSFYVQITPIVILTL